jgi:hypothetical protein
MWCCCAAATRKPWPLRNRAALERLDFIARASHAEPARALHLLGLQSRIRLTLPHFMVVPPILAATDLAVILPSAAGGTFRVTARRCR